MFNHVRRYSRVYLCGIASVIAFVIVIVWTNHQRLRKFGDAIEENFGSQIAAIEKSMGKIQDSGNCSIVREELDQALNTSALFLAVMSYDGHHGVCVLKSTPEGMRGSTYRFSARTGGNATVSSSRSDSRCELVVYFKPVPAGRIWRHMQLVFIQTELERLIKDKKRG